MIGVICSVWDSFSSVIDPLFKCADDRALSRDFMSVTARFCFWEDFYRLHHEFNIVYESFTPLSDCSRW